MAKADFSDARILYSINPKQATETTAKKIVLSERAASERAALPLSDDCEPLAELSFAEESASESESDLESDSDPFFE